MSVGFQHDAPICGSEFIAYLPFTADQVAAEPNVWDRSAWVERCVDYWLPVKFRLEAGLELEELRFDWDPAKREINLQKHDIDFRDAIAVFEDAQHNLEDTTRAEHGERRTKAIGRVGALLICVIFTDRGEFRRIISARRARRDEREQYRHGAEAV